MFLETRQRLALWYTGVTAILLLLFATGFYIYVRSTLIERIDDTLNHVVEIVQRSLVVEPATDYSTNAAGAEPTWRINLSASFPSNSAAVEDDHIDLEWFSPAGDLLWSTFLRQSIFRYILITMVKLSMLLLILAVMTAALIAVLARLPF